MDNEGLYNLFLSNPSVCTDTRKITRGSIFFALKGPRFDGNNFAAQALKSGAAYAIVDNPEVVSSGRFILVNNVLDALQKLAARHRKKSGLPVIAVTGTNGKTTTKELVASVLEKKYKTRSTQGNLNNHIGVPLTLLRISKEDEIGIVEMGANHPGEIASLCKIADPDYGLITNIGKAHLEGFGSFEGIKKTKAELYGHLAKKNGKIFIHNDDEVLRTLAPGALEKISYGTTSDSFMRGEIASQSPFLNLRAWFPKGLLYLRSKLIGSYNFENILAAACVGKYFNVDPLLIQEAIYNYVPGNNRSQMIIRGTNKIIMDAYNANPTSMDASIRNFIGMPGKNKCLILGDMLELGKESADEHQKIVTLFESYPFHQIFLVGRYFSGTSFSGLVKPFKTVGELAGYLRQNRIKNSLILIKGSRGLSLEKVLEAF